MTEPGLAWIKSSLLSGLSLSRRALALLNLDSGGVTSLVPPTPADLLDFSAGIGLSRKDSWDWVYGKLMRLAVASGKRALVVENDLAKPTDPILAERMGETLFFAGEVFHYLDLPHCPSREALAFVGRSASGYPLNVFLTEVTNRETSELGPADLDAIVAGTSAIVAGSFDGEGFTLWVPQELAQTVGP